MWQGATGKRKLKWLATPWQTYGQSNIRCIKSLEIFKMSTIYTYDFYFLFDLIFWFFLQFLRFIYTFLKSKYKKCSFKKNLITNFPMYAPLFLAKMTILLGMQLCKKDKTLSTVENSRGNLRAHVKVSIQRKRNYVDAFVNPRNIYGSLYQWERGCQFKILKEILLLKVNKHFFFNLN